MFCQTPLHVLGVSVAHHQEVQRLEDNSHLKRIISTKCWIHTVVPPDDGLQILPKLVEAFDEIF